MKQFAKSMLFKSKFLILILIILQGCAIAPRYATGNTKFSTSKKVKSFKTSKKEGKQRKITTGISSFYAEDFHGKLTANGEVYDMYGLTAAHRTMPLNTICRVTNLANDRSLILRINDRGPFVKGRILDCSYGAAKKLDFVNEGTAKVKIEVIEWGDGKYMQHNEVKK